MSILDLGNGVTAYLSNGDLTLWVGHNEEDVDPPGITKQRITLTPEAWGRLVRWLGGGRTGDL